MKPAGGQAFPKAGDEERVATEGMSLRDYFAAHVAGQVAAVAFAAGKLNGNDDMVALTAYAVADAMLKAREAE